MRKGGLEVRKVGVGSICKATSRFLMLVVTNMVILSFKVILIVKVSRN